MHTEAESVSPVDANDRTTQPVQPDFTPEDSLKPAMVNPVETPLVPTLAPTETKSRSNATTKRATAKQDEGKKPTAQDHNRNTVETRSRTSRQKSWRDLTQYQTDYRDAHCLRQLGSGRRRCRATATVIHPTRDGIQSKMKLEMGFNQK